MPSRSVPDSLRRGRPSDSVASMWKCTSTKGGETRLPPASTVWPASPAISGSTASIRPPRTAMSRPTRPLGRVALRTIRSKLMDGPRLSLALEIRDHQGLGVVGPASDRNQGGDREKIGKHQKDL